METVEMDLIQAQIGSLATDLSRVEAKAAGGGYNRILVADLSTPPDIRSGQKFDYFYKSLATQIENGSDFDNEELGIVFWQYRTEAFKCYANTVTMNGMAQDLGKTFTAVYATDRVTPYTGDLIIVTPIDQWGTDVMAIGKDPQTGDCIPVMLNLT